MEEKTLQETKNELLLRRYFTDMKNFYGEDIALGTAIEEDDIRKSISMYSKYFDNCDKNDIYDAIIKRCIFCQRGNNYLIDYAQSQIDKGKIDTLYQDLDASIYLKASLIKYYIETSEHSTYDMVQKAIDKGDMMTKLARISKPKENSDIKRLKKEGTTAN